MRFSYLLFALLLSACLSGQQPHDHLKLTSQQWREDLQFLAKQLPKRHANAFHFTTQGQFETAVKALDQGINQLDGDEVFVRMNCIARSIGDGHTYVEFPPERARFPIAFKKFGDEFRVVGIAPGHESALGTKLLRIDSTSVSVVYDRLYCMTPQDENPNYAPALIQGYMSLGLVLHGFQIIANRNLARFIVANDDGSEKRIDLRADSGKVTQLTRLPAEADRPLYMQEPQNMFMMKYLSESRTLYCAVRQIADLKRPSKEMLKMISDKKPDKLIIDIRQNGGGDYFDGLDYLVNPIKELPAINKKGHLFVIIGPLTFSAAMSNTSHFRSMTEAVLVGESIGEKPNSYQESDRVTLPNSMLTLGYSTKFYKFVDGENIIRPDQEVIPSWEEYKSGVDPVVKWILKQN